MLREISLFWSAVHTLVLFLLLFESRYSNKKTICISLATMLPLIAGNMILLFFLDTEQIGLILLLTLSLPSLVVFFILAKKRNGSFFFTFCLVDTLVLEILYVTQIINHYVTPDNNVFMFIVRLVIFPLLEWIVYKKIRAVFLDVQAHTEGWGLFAVIAAIFYVLISLVMNYPTSIVTRPEYLPAAILLFVLIPVIYFHIIKILYRQQHVHEMTETDNILAMQVSSLTSRMDELFAANDKFRMERHNFRHKLKTLTSLMKTEQYDECRILLAEYEEALDKTKIKRYCQHTVIDATLSSYIQKAETKGIDVRMGFAFPDTISISQTELATAIANALENAINACEKVEPSKRYIDIKVLNYPRFMIQIANSYVGDIEFNEQGVPVNHENDHGFGTRFIAAFCKKNDGFYQFSADGERFTLYLNF